MSDAKDTIGAGLTAFAKKQVIDLLEKKIGSDSIETILEFLSDKVRLVAEEAVADHEKRRHGETDEAPPEAETEA